MSHDPCHAGVRIVTVSDAESRGELLTCSCCLSETSLPVVHMDLLPGKLPKRFIRICQKCVTVLRSVPPGGGEYRRRPNGMRLILKRFVSKDEETCFSGDVTFTGGALAVHRPGGMCVFCDRCLDDMGRVLPAWIARRTAS